MHITLSAIGKLKDPALKALYQDYVKRMDWKLTLHEFEGKHTIHQEGDLLLKSIPHPSFLVILDEKGDNLKSEEFSALLQTIQLHHQGKVSFIIGGASGLSEEIKAKANRSLAFGRMTWPHLLIRVMLIEQLYRAQQILKGHPYHRE
jgi:23S rRNA (pseudouridine1915-N3)-methyltransferase